MGHIATWLLGAPDWSGLDELVQWLALGSCVFVVLLGLAIFYSVRLFRSARARRIGARMTAGTSALSVGLLAHASVDQWLDDPDSGFWQAVLEPWIQLHALPVLVIVLLVPLVLLMTIGAWWKFGRGRWLHRLEAGEGIEGRVRIQASDLFLVREEQADTRLVVGAARHREPVPDGQSCVVIGSPGEALEAYREEARPRFALEAIFVGRLGPVSTRLAQQRDQSDGIAILLAWPLGIAPLAIVALALYAF